MLSACQTSWSNGNTDHKHGPKPFTPAGICRTPNISLSARSFEKDQKQVFHRKMNLLKVWVSVVVNRPSLIAILQVSFRLFNSFLLGISACRPPTWSYCFSSSLQNHHDLCNFSIYYMPLHLNFCLKTNPKKDGYFINFFELFMMSRSAASILQKIDRNILNIVFSSFHQFP